MKPIRIILGVCIASWLSYILILQFIMWLPDAADKKFRSVPELNAVLSESSNHSNTLSRLIEGRVVTYWGKPVSGISLTIPSEPFNNQFQNSPSNKAVSNKDGYFLIRTALPPGFSILTKATNVYKSSTSYVDSYSKILRIELRFQELIRVSGKVMDTFGIPVQGATIYYDSKNALSKSDEGGRFDIQVSQTRLSNPKLTVIRGGYKPVELTLNEQHYANKKGIDIRLEHSIHTMTAQGWIGDVSGFGLSGQRIYMSSINDDIREPDIEDYFALSDLEGLFEFEGIIADRAYQLEVYPTISQGKMIHKTINTSSDMDPINITVESIQLAPLAGIITDLDLNPLPDIQININSKVSTNYNMRVNTNDAGEFYIKQFPVGSITFQTSNLPYLTVLGIEHIPSERQQIKVPIDLGQTSFSGRINSMDGNPVAFAIVALKAFFQLGKTQSSSNRITFTDVNGVYEFNNVGRGLHNLSVISKEYSGVQLSYYIDEKSMIENITLQ